MQQYGFRFIASGDHGGTACRAGQPPALRNHHPLVLDRKLLHSPDFGGTAIPAWLDKWKSKNGPTVDP